MDIIQHSVTGRKAFSIEEFCAAHGFCRATFYNLLKDGKGPRVMKLRGRRFVSEEAAREWRAAMTEAAA